MINYKNKVILKLRHILALLTLIYLYFFPNHAPTLAVIAAFAYYSIATFGNTPPRNKKGQFKRQTYLNDFIAPLQNALRWIRSNF